jgi:hypothetical protein
LEEPDTVPLPALKAKRDVDGVIKSTTTTITYEGD